MSCNEQPKLHCWQQQTESPHQLRQQHLEGGLTDTSPYWLVLKQLQHSKNRSKHRKILEPPQNHGRIQSSRSSSVRAYRRICFFYTDSENQLANVSVDLRQIVSFLRHHATSRFLDRIDDWWEHDALQFTAGKMDFTKLVQMVGSPQALFDSMTGEYRVFVALSPKPNRRWYLRFFADQDGLFLTGEYSIALDDKLSKLFADELLPTLQCKMSYEGVQLYFRRIGDK